MIDFHCHLDLYQDPQEVIRGLSNWQGYLLAVTTTPLAWDGTKELVRGLPRVRVALGLHPQLVASRHAEIDLLCSLVPDTDYIGEIGLDGSDEHKKSLGLQEKVFAQALATCASNGGRVISIHSRRATTRALDVIETYPLCGNAILHWFSGTLRELERAIALGCWFSVGPAMLSTKKGLRLAAAMPRDRVLTETDGPFGTTITGPLMPWDVILAERQLSRVWGMHASEVSSALMSNLKSLITRSRFLAPDGVSN